MRIYAYIARNTHVYMRVYMYTDSWIRVYPLDDREIPMIMGIEFLFFRAH
jgi:hypothetical protein